MKKFKAAIIGCGRIGSEYDDDPKRIFVASHAGAYTKNSEIELVALCDTDSEKLEKAGAKWKISGLYKNYEEMLEKEKPEIISICTQVESHAEILEKCVNAKPLAILCEKPIAKNIEEAEKMVRICREKKVILQVNYMRRFSPAYREIADYLKSEKMGKIQKITGHYGDGLITNASHLINLAEFFCESEFSKVASIKTSIESRYENDANYAFVAESKDGIIFSLTPQNNKNYLILELCVYCEKGAILFKKNGFEISVFETDEHSLFSGFKELKEIGYPFKNKPDGEFMMDSVNCILECIKTSSEPLCSGEDALKTLKFVANCMNNN